MKKYGLMFFIFFMLICMLGLLFFTGAIYDAENKSDIQTFFFEPGTKSANRISVPVSADEMPDNFLRDMIIARFVHEYFYVIPSRENAEKRLNFVDYNGKHTALRGLLSQRESVYKDWAENIGPEIVKLANDKAMRTVRVVDISETESGHLVVKYQLKTWTKPNDVFAQPVITDGVMFLSVTRGPIHVEQTQEVLNRLKTGDDPISAFNFRILDVRLK